MLGGCTDVRYDLTGERERVMGLYNKYPGRDECKLFVRVRVLL